MLPLVLFAAIGSAYLLWSEKQKRDHVALYNALKGTSVIPVDVAAAGEWFAFRIVKGEAPDFQVFDTSISSDTNTVITLATEEAFAHGEGEHTVAFYVTPDLTKLVGIKDEARTPPLNYEFLTDSNLGWPRKD